MIVISSWHHLFAFMSVLNHTVARYVCKAEKNKQKIMVFQYSTAKLASFPNLNMKIEKKMSLQCITSTGTYNEA